MGTELRRWLVGDAPLATAPDGVVALTVSESAAPGHTLVAGFHEAMSGDVPRASDQVDVIMPGYRGKCFIPVLAWLAAARLSTATTPVVWHVGKQQGPDSVRRLLESLGWQLEQTRQGRTRLLSGLPPPGARLPEPRRFTAEIGALSLGFAADHGLFSPAGIDAGTQLMLEVALRCPPAGALADVGTGYGALAIGLVRNGIAARAVATDVDSVALWLAMRNAAENGVDLAPVWTADPSGVEPTPLTVCNVPTHISAEQTGRLMRGLLRRARHGRLLVVVHSSLEARYSRYFSEAGITPVRHPGPAHVVLDSGT